MTLPTESHPTPNFPSVGGEGGGAASPGAAVLDPAVYQDMRWCNQCSRLQVFVETDEYEWGRVAWCFGCGARHEIPFSRATGEAA